MGCMNMFDFFLPYIFFISPFDQVYYPQLFLTIDTNFFHGFERQRKIVCCIVFKNNIRKLIYEHIFSLK